VVATKRLGAVNSRLVLRSRNGNRRSRRGRYNRYALQGENRNKATDPLGLTEVMCSDGNSNFTVRRDSGGNIVIVDGGAKYDELTKDILNYASTEDKRYLNRLPVSNDPLTAKAVESAIAEATRLYGTPSIPNSSDVGTALQQTGNSTVANGVSPDVVLMMAMGIAGSTGGDPSKRDINAALRALDQNIKFRRFFHQEYKADQGIPGGGKNNPDLDANQVWDAYQEWQQMKR